MKTYPLPQMSIEEAMATQFRFIDEITRVFPGHELLTQGDLGVVPGYNKPITTKKVEQVLASFFHAEASILVRGAGTGAIRYALFAILKPTQTLLVHKAPIYTTTKTSIEMMGLRVVEADFNDLSDIMRVMNQHPEIQGALIQYTRQVIEDCYDMEEVIKTIKAVRVIPIVTDDNYAIMKVHKSGSECGADLACFSTFKLLGPEGIGCIVGKQKYIDALYQIHYSGGMQTQGFEALEVLRGLTYAPVSLAIQSKVIEEVANRLNLGEVLGVERAVIANAQSRVLLVQFKEAIAKDVLEVAEKLGAAPNPIGAESKYELIPMFYRVSGTIRDSDPTLENTMIRINPMRCGADTVIRILREALEQVKSCF